MRIYIGITGSSGTGKDTVASMLARIATANGLQFYRYNLSDEIREELARRGQPADVVSREILIEVGNELRATYGGGALASRIVAKDRTIHPQGPASLLVVTGIRNPQEVLAFRHEWEEQFLLLAVEASSELRAARKTCRQQYQEDTHLSSNVEQADLAIGIPACVQMADWRVRNDGTLAELEAAIQAFFQRSVLPKYR